MASLETTRVRRIGRVARFAFVLLFLASPAVVFAQDKKAAKDPVVATVNGQDVHLSAVRAAYGQLPQRYRAIPFAQLYQPLLAQVIDMKLIAAAGRKKGLQNDAGVKTRLKLVEDRLIQQVYLQKLVDAKISTDLLKERYADFIKNHKPKDEVRASHILVQSEKEAKEVIKQLNGGADFAKLAKEKSTGPSKSRGGDLGFFTKKRMVKPFADAAYAMKKGDVSKEPVKTRFGYHVIKVTDRRKTPAPAFDAVKAKLRQGLSQKLITQEVAALRTGAKIERFNQDGTPMAKKDDPKTDKSEAKDGKDKK